MSLIEGGPIYLDSGQILNIKLITSSIGNSNISTSAIYMLSSIGNYQNITNVKDPINQQDAATKQYVDNLGIIINDITLIGTSGTLISDKLKGSYSIHISNTVLNGPSGIFYLTKSEMDREAGKFRMIAAPGYSTNTFLDIYWPINSGIYLHKTDSNYDGSYNIKII